MANYEQHQVIKFTIKDPTKYQYFDNGHSVRVTFVGTQTTLTVWSGADYPQTWQQTDLDAAVAALLNPMEVQDAPAPVAPPPDAAPASDTPAA